jgi:spore germination protein KC
MIEQAEQDPGLAAGLDDLARTGAENGSSVETAVWEVAKALCDPDADFCLPRLVSDGESVWVDGSAVFRGDRMVCTLSEAETKGLLILRGEPEFCSVTWKSESLGAVTVVVSQIQSELKLDCSGETPCFTVSVECVGVLGERTDAEKTDPAFLALAEEECAAEITHWIRLAIRTALRQNGADPFGFGRTLRQKAPQVWAEMDEEWHAFLQKCRYQAEVSVRCR